MAPSRSPTEPPSSKVPKFKLTLRPPEHGWGIHSYDVTQHFICYVCTCGQSCSNRSKRVPDIYMFSSLYGKCFRNCSSQLLDELKSTVPGCSGGAGDAASCFPRPHNPIRWGWLCTWSLIGLSAAGVLGSLDELMASEKRGGCSTAALDECRSILK